jgi:HlyD family secretion protein
VKHIKRILIPALVLIIAVCLILILLRNKESAKTTYTFAEVTRGDIENTVDATGTIEPVTTVEVGTQVSGIIDRIFVDFNDHVTRNQLMAVIDTTILSLQVRDARASVIRNQAQYDQAKYNFERTEKLYQQNLLSEYEFITAKSNYQSALSTLMSAQNNLERAERNMRYAFIRSPIDGTVIYREVEEGQTVASSFQTPRLFLIAEDLSKMEIHALVDESEIGLIKEGQSVRFNVQAHEDDTFYGLVRQVWLQPETVQNVVNYTVVVDAENPDGLLLPGMTAMLEFLVEQKKDVLTVPVAATKLQPTESMMKIMFENRRKQMEARGDSVRAPRGGFSGNFNRQRTGGETGSGMPMMNLSNFALLWYLDENKNLQAAPVRTGSSDGRNIEITPMREIKIEPGLQVISGIESNEAAATQNMPRMGGFRRGPF